MFSDPVRVAAPDSRLSTVAIEQQSPHLNEANGPKV